MPTEEHVIETFRCPPDLKKELDGFALRYDMTRSEVMREALEMYFMIMKFKEATVWGAVTEAMIWNSTKIKP